MKVADFDFNLPRALIAERPVEPRDSARLLLVAKTLADRHVRDLPDLLKPGDLLVLNDTRVIPARLVGRRGAAKIEATLHKQEAADRWRAFARPAKRLKRGDRIDFGKDVEATLSAEVVEKGEGGEVVLRFDVGGDSLFTALDRIGRMPLPPYIARAAGAGRARPQRLSDDLCAPYGRGRGADRGAAFHADDLLERLAARGVERTFVTLHVGAGTFLPVKVEDTRDHVMHAEWGRVSAEAAAAIAATRSRGGRIVACGTTALRLVETAAQEDGTVPPFEGDTALFITPGYRFKAVDLLLTNFHLPRSTLFMLVAAFAGLERMRAAYEHAKGAGYRFYSYGDACLLEPASCT